MAKMTQYTENVEEKTKKKKRPILKKKNTKEYRRRYQNTEHKIKQKDI